MMKKALMFLLAITLISFAFATDATVIIPADSSKDLQVNGKQLSLQGPIREIEGEKLMAFGEQGYNFPAKGLIGEKGTIVFTFALAPQMVKSQSAARSLAILRFNGREEIGFYTFFNKHILQYRFANQRENFYGESPKLTTGKIYCGAFTWDGDEIRCYLDGTLIQEVKQPFPLKEEKVAFFFIGPYRDSWYDTATWHDDTLFRELRLYHRALSPQEIAALSSKQSRSVKERYPRTITAPKQTTLQIRGNSILGVIDMTAPQKSWELPPNSGCFSWDEKGLNIHVSTIFPAHTNLSKGGNSSDPESSVWNAENFELLLRHSGKTFYFAGAVNGCKCEMLNHDVNYNPAWQFDSSLSMQIDDTFLWKGNISIPWQALQLAAPPKELKMNFCRSFCNSHITTPSDLANKTTGKEGYWAGNEYFYTLKLTEGTPSITPVRLGNPSFGTIDQEFELTSPVDRSVRFSIIQESDAELIPPQSLIEKNIALKANKIETVKIQASLTALQADRLVYKLASEDGKEVYFCQDMPLAISAEYLQLTPLFTAGKIQFSVKTEILKKKIGSDARFNICLRNIQKEILYSSPVVQENGVVPFEKNNPPGLYVMEIRSANNELLSEKSFFYPGFGEWSKMTFDETRILPPFTPMKYTRGKDSSLTANVVLRSYQWQKNSIFPAQIVSLDENLLVFPASIRINDKDANGNFLCTSSEQHRAEFQSNATTEEYKIFNKGWLEYDGVQHNSINVVALTDLKQVELRFVLPRNIAKYLHTASCGWGNKITAKIENGTRNFKYYPVVFLGNEEKGLCFFAESNQSWSGNSSKPLSITANQDNATFTITIADALKKGQSLDFDFGFLATPVKPLNKIHPLNTSGWFFQVGMNRPDKQPAVWSSYLPLLSVLSDAFADIPGADNNTLIKKLREDVAFAKQHHVHPFPYNPLYVTDEYPEIKAFGTEWEIIPRQLWNGRRNGIPYMLSMLCPASQGADFFLYHLKKYLEKVPVDGINLDFGIVPICDNTRHGCHQRTPLMAYRNFFRKIAMLLLDSGVKEYVIHVHNTNSVQLPSYTFVTHLLNGEHIRQESSTLMHHGKDILDSYPIEMFACELSSMPFGIYNAAYQANEALLKEYGGGDEDPELYKLRITRAFMAGMLIHNSFNDFQRIHYGLMDKVVRIYSEFGVPQSQFIGYWDKRGIAKVIEGKDVYASVYRHPSDNRLLVIISHIGNKRIDQNISIQINTDALKMTKLNHAVERMEMPDKEYEELYTIRKQHNLSPMRIPLKWENAGIKLLGFKDNILQLNLPAHSFAIVELSD